MPAINPNIKDFIEHVEKLPSNVSSKDRRDPKLLQYRSRLIQIYGNIIKEVDKKLENAGVTKSYITSNLVFAELLPKDKVLLEKLEKNLAIINSLSTYATQQEEISAQRNKSTNEEEEEVFQRIQIESGIVDLYSTVVQAAIFSIDKPQGQYIRDTSATEVDPLVYTTTKRILDDKNFVSFSIEQIKSLAIGWLGHPTDENIDQINAVVGQVTLAQDVQKTINEYNKSSYAADDQLSQKLEAVAKIKDITDACNNYLTNLETTIAETISVNDPKILSEFLIATKNEEAFSSELFNSKLIDFTIDYAATGETPLTQQTRTLLDEFNYVNQGLMPLLEGEGEATAKIEQLKDKYFAIKGDMKKGDKTSSSFFQKFLEKIAEILNISPKISPEKSQLSAETNSDMNKAKSQLYTNIQSSLFNQSSKDKPHQKEPTKPTRRM